MPPVVVPRALWWAVAAAGAAALCWAAALGNLSAPGTGGALRVWYLGGAAGPAFFSARGWRYRQAARLFESLALLLALLAVTA